jgi:L-cysteine:1D-myo-inositol 2-amino-2-deoxy-alpha-D-glucopyranoside ligase
VFVRDLIGRASPGAARLVLAAHHYRTPWSYREELLEEAAGRHRSWCATADGDALVDPEEAAAVERAFLARLDDDLDTPGALRVLDGLAESAARSHIRAEGGTPAAPLMEWLAGVLGVRLSSLAAELVETSRPG